MAEKHLEIAGEGAAFADFFGGGFERLRVEGAGVGIVADAVAGHGEAHGDDHVVEHGVGGQRGEKRAADGVDRAGAADAGIEARLGGAQKFFVAPVGVHARARRAGRGVDFERATDRAEARVGEVRGEPRDGIRGETLARVGEDDDLGGGLRERGIEARRLARALRLHEDADARGIDRRRARDRGVGGAVRDDEHAQFFRRIIRRQQVRDTRGDAGLLVVRDHHHAHVWQRRGRGLFLPATTAREQRHERAVAGEGVKKQRARKPESRSRQRGGAQKSV